MQRYKMRKIKPLALTALAILTIILAVGCSNGAGEKNSSETKKTEETDKSQDTETKEENEKGADLSSMFQNLDTVDIKGEKVTKEIFADNKLTLVNIWATWCGPCVGEMPELEKLSKEYEGKGIAIKGLLAEVDMTDGKLVEGLTDTERTTAEEILNGSNITYQQILISKAMKEQLGIIQGFPTTYFIDKDGNIVGKPFVGANSKDEWKKIIEQRLDMLEAK